MGKPLLTWLLLILSVVSLVIYYAARVIWVFVDIMVDIESFTFGKNDIFIEAIDNSGKKVFNEYVTW